MGDMAIPLDDEIGQLTQHLVAAFDELHEAVRQKLLAGAYTATHHDYPLIHFRDNGFPYFTDRGFYGSEGPRNYVDTTRPTSLASALLIDSRDKTELPKNRALVAFLQASSFAPKFFGWGSFSDYHIDKMLDGAVEKYMHLHGTGPLVKAKRGNLLRPLFRSILFEDYPLRLVVPVALTGFDVDHYPINESTYLMKIPTSLQQARARRKGMGSGASDGALESATHAFVWTGWSISPGTFHDLEESLNSPSSNVLEAVDLMFACLRAATGATTGYAQVLFCPQRWATKYYVDLPHIYGFSIRRYPGAFDATYWHTGHPTVTKAEMAELRRIYNLALPLENDRVSIALKRLNSCMTREDAADAILDATIGLEVLLGDGNDAISYKIRMRAAALTLLRGDRKAGELLDKVKGIYTFRSNIVHGVTTKSKSSKKIGSDSLQRFIEQRDNAIEVLRYIIDVLVEHPKYLKPEAIDRELMLTLAAQETAAAADEPKIPGL